MVMICFSVEKLWEQKTKSWDWPTFLGLNDAQTIENSCFNFHKAYRWTSSFVGLTLQRYINQTQKLSCFHLNLFLKKKNTLGLKLRKVYNTKYKDLYNTVNLC